MMPDATPAKPEPSRTGWPRQVDVADDGDITDLELIITVLRLLVASGWNNRVSSVYIQWCHPRSATTLSSPMVVVTAK
jgi:hypothetical protein